MAKLKGDILIRKDNDYVEELNIGVDGTVMIADSTQDSGFVFDTPHTVTKTVATGTAYVNRPVVLNDDGTVSPVIKDPNLVNQTNEIAVASIQGGQVIRLSDTEVAGFYSGDYGSGRHGYTKIGQVNGDEVIWGNATQVDTTGFSGGVGRLFIYAPEIDRFINFRIGYEGTLYTYRCRVNVGERVGDEIIWGPDAVVPYDFNTGTNSSARFRTYVAWHPIEERIVMFYSFSTSGVTICTLRICAASVNTSTNVCTVGTHQDLHTLNSEYDCNMMYDTATNKILLAYGSSGTHYVRTATLSDTTFTLNATTVALGGDGGNQGSMELGYDESKDKYITCYEDVFGTQNVYHRVIDMATEPPTMGAAYQYGTGAWHLTYDNQDERIIFGYGGYNTWFNIHDDNTISFDTDERWYWATLVTDGYIYTENNMAFVDNHDRWVSLGRGDVDNGTTHVFTKIYTSNMTSSNYLGVATVHTNIGQDLLIGTQGYEATIYAGGSLIPGESYYVSPYGKIRNNDIRQPFVGQAVSSTEYIVKGYDNGVKEEIQTDVISLQTDVISLSGAIDFGSVDTTALSAAIDTNTDNITSNDVDIIALSGAIDGNTLGYFVETHNIGAPNATVPVNQWLGIGAETNIDVAITPKGTGALLVQIPTGTTAGGNKRGTYALDFQRTRSATGDVASGTYSIIMGGKDNEATGAYSILVGGFSNHATGDYAFIGGGTANTSSGEGSTIAGGYFNRAQGQESTCAGGYTGNAAGLRSTVSGGEGGQATGTLSTITGGGGCQAIGDYSTAGGAETFATGDFSVASGYASNARIYGSSSHASGNFTGGTRGDCQHTKYVLRISGNSTRTLTTNQLGAGAANQIVLEDDQMMIFQGTVTAKLSGSEIAAWQIEGLITRDTGVASTLLITHTITEISNTPGWSIALSADTTNGALKVETTVDGSLACSSMAVIESTEMIYTL